MARAYAQPSTAASRRAAARNEAMRRLLRIILRGRPRCVGSRLGAGAEREAELLRRQLAHRLEQAIGGAALVEGRTHQIDAGVVQLVLGVEHVERGLAAGVAQAPL